MPGIRTKRRSSYKLEPQSPVAAALGRTYRHYREKAGLSLRAASSAIGVCHWNIRRHEAGNLLLRTDALLDSAAAFGVGPEALLQTEVGDG